VNKDKLKKVIDSYLKSGDELAYQIDAEWGTGKTYFVKNELIDEIEKGKQYRPVYLSINGIDNLDELKQKLNLNLLLSLSKRTRNKSSKKIALATMNFIDSGIMPILPYIGHSYKNVKKALGDSFNELFFAPESKLKYSKVVILIDEFERCSISICDLVGYLSDVLNNYGCKMVIISNETEINELNQFYKIKEKLINKTGKLNITTQQIYDDVISKKLKHSDVPDVVQQYIKGFNKVVFDQNIFDGIIPGMNIRTLKSIISSFNQIIEAYKESDKIDWNSEMSFNGLKLAYTSIFITTQALKQGMDMKQINNNRYRPIFNNAWDKSKNDKEESVELKYLRKLSDIPAPYSRYIQINEPIKMLVQNGYIEIDSYNNLVNELFSMDEFDQLLNVIADFKTLDESQLSKLEYKIATYYKHNELSLKQKIRLYLDFNFFKDSSLLLIDFDFNSLQEDVLSCIKDSDKILDENEDISILFYAKSLMTVDDNIKFKENINSTIESHNLDKQLQIINNDIINILKNGDYTNYHSFYDDKVKINNIFNLLLENNNIVELLHHNDSLDKLDRFLIHEIKGKRRINVEDAKKFESELSGMKNKNHDKIYQYNIKQLLKTIHSIISEHS
jgi:hypothetical protein